MKIYRPLQLSFNSQVMEQGRKFYFVVSATLGVDLQTGDELLDLNYLKDVFESMGENPIPDTGMPKPNGEFLVSGSFYSPEKEMVTGGEVKVKLGDIEKSLYVFGSRKWVKGFPSKPEMVNSVPLEWSNSFGGEGFKNNPDGMGYNDEHLPLIENPKKIVSSPKDTPDPACFSQQSQMVPQRIKYQGTYDNSYLDKYFPGHPKDLDWRYFLCAQEDQWIKDFYKGNENFALFNMHPEIPEVKGSLPGLYARCFLNHVKNGTEHFQEIPLNIDTVWFFPEKLLTLLTFRGVVEVADDEAEEVSHILCAYEDKEKESHSLEYYKKAFEKRKSSDDSMLNNMNTQDLIPAGHKCAMELLMGSALEDSEESEFSKNLDAKAESMQKMADEKMEEAIKKNEKNLENIAVPGTAKDHIPLKDGKIDIRELMDSKKDAEPDPDVTKFKEKLEAILPGITSGDPKKLEMKNFSFDKIDKISEAANELSDKKEKEGKEIAKNEIEKAKNQVKDQIQKIDIEIEKVIKSTPEDSEHIKSLQDAKIEIEKNLIVFDAIDIDGTKTETALPRINVEEIKEQTARIDPKIMEISQHLQSAKTMGFEDENTKEMEKKIQDLVGSTSSQIDEALKEAESSFKEGYIMGAHFMDKGLSPHKTPVEEVKDNFLKAVSGKKDVSGGDWACLDLSYENLEGVNLSGAYIEQVNFKGANLKNADFSGAILSRAIFDDADCSNAKFVNANVGAVHAHRTNFSGADFKEAKLSKGDFAGSDFTNASLEGIETMELIVDYADFSNAYMPQLIFMEIKISGAKFTNADMNTTIFLKCELKDCDFTGAVLERAAFVDVGLDCVSFEKANISSGCFVATEPGKTTMENINFGEAFLKQTNFQSMELKGTNFGNANVENAFFGSADLSNSDFSNVYGKNAQFRKAKLTGANFNNIILYEGSLAKAHLVNATFKGANLYGVDFLRSTITNTDFNDSNLDSTLIKDWRPE